MAALVAAIHESRSDMKQKGVDGRTKSGHDVFKAYRPPHFKTAQALMMRLQASFSTSVEVA
jgi:hypothetical protein